LAHDAAVELKRIALPIGEHLDRHKPLERQDSFNRDLQRLHIFEKSASANKRFAALDDQPERRAGCYPSRVGSQFDIKPDLKRPVLLALWKQTNYSQKVEDWKNLISVMSDLKDDYFWTNESSAEVRPL
jgi:hypothetical protein